MAGKLRRKGKPYNPAAALVPVRVHERKSSDLLRNALVAGLEVDDPYEQGAKIVVLRSLRDDPLGRLHARKQIDEAQYQGGRAFQRDFELAERGPQAIDPSKEFVDGGRLPEPITESQRRAAVQLALVYKKLGQNGSAIVHDILIHGLTLEKVGAKREMRSEIELKYLGRRFRECLDELSVLYGLAMREMV